MKRIVALHRRSTQNAGDLSCCPSDYFPIVACAERLDIFGYHLDEAGSASVVDRWYSEVTKADVIVIGGGGLLSCEFFAPCLDEVEKARRPDSKVVIWGCGHNQHDFGGWGDLKPKIDYGSLSPSLIGLRDWGYPYHWAPCPSVMSGLFDRNREAVHDVVVYAHRDQPLTTTMRNNGLDLPAGTPLLDNDASMESAIDFLASGQLVLTDSYHGALWATLLGKAVVAVPTSSKFFSLRHPVPVFSASDWRRASMLARRYPDALTESRRAAALFEARFRHVVGL
jgi:hypothetical protein